MKRMILALLLIASPAYAESYFEGPWVWNEDCIGGGGCWQPPQGASAGVDLRTIEEQSRQGGDGGRGIFVSDAFSITGYKKLTKKQAETLLWDEFTVKSDPDGVTGPRPLMPNKHGDMHLRIGKIHKVEKLDFASPQGEKVKAIWRKDFERMPSEEGRRFLGALEKVHGVNPVPEVKSLEPHTTITESFDKANNGLGPDLTWTAAINTMGVLSNQFISKAGSGNYSAARADSDLSSADNYAQISVTALDPVGGGSGDQVKIGVNTRQSATTASTFYNCTVFSNGAGAKYNIISKFVAGAETQLVVTGPGETHPATPFAVKLDVNGSTIDMYVDGVLEDTTTDSSITANLRTGIFCYFAGSGNAKGDAFIASDGITPASSVQRAYII